jgi:phenylacetate-CoA ligase
MADLSTPPELWDTNERMSVDELRARQLTTLQDTVRRVYERVPHYARAFDEAGVHPNDLRDQG